MGGGVLVRAGRVAEWRSPTGGRQLAAGRGGAVHRRAVRWRQPATASPVVLLVRILLVVALLAFPRRKFLASPRLLLHGHPVGGPCLLPVLPFYPLLFGVRRDTRFGPLARRTRRRRTRWRAGRAGPLQDFGRCQAQLHGLLCRQGVTAGAVVLYHDLVALTVVDHGHLVALPVVHQLYQRRVDGYGCLRRGLSCRRLSRFRLGRL